MANLSHIRCFFLSIGWCYCQFFGDLITIFMAGVLAILLWWMFLPLLYYVNFYGRCYCHIDVEDVFTTLCYILIMFYWLMLLPFIVVADLIAICLWLMLLPLCVVYYCLFNSKVADVIAMVCGWWKTTFCLFVFLADVIAMVVDGNNHLGWDFLADVMAMVADGIATGQLYFNLSFWDVQQNLIPYLWQMDLAYISIKGRIVSPDVNGFFDCSEEVLVFPLPIYWNHQ